MSSYLKKTNRGSGGDFIGTEPADALVEDFYHNKQNRADKRQQKWLRKKEQHDLDDYEDDYRA
jgi:glycosylphosphatidylinositol transamidase (GPIT) subunit GPI8